MAFENSVGANLNAHAFSNGNPFSIARLFSVSLFDESIVGFVDGCYWNLWLLASINDVFKPILLL